MPSAREKLNLYRVENGLGTFWAVAKDFESASRTVETILRKRDWGYGGTRETRTVTLIASGAKDLMFVESEE